MRTILFHIPNEIPGLPGIPVFGFGVLLAAWGLFSVLLLLWLLRRQGLNWDTLSYVPVLALVAAALGWLLPGLMEREGFPIRGYGVMLLVAVLAGTALTVWRGHRAGLDPDLVFSMVFWMFLPGILGARLFFAIQYWNPQFQAAFAAGDYLGLLVRFVRFDQGGLVFYGGLLGAVPGLLVFARSSRLPVLALCDLVAPSVLLAVALGRIGCLLNGCCWGGVCEHSWAVTFPDGSPPYGSQVARGQLYGFRLTAQPDEAPVLMAVDPDSQAARAGWKKGDRIEAINGTRVQTARQVHRIIWDAFDAREPLSIEVQDRELLLVSPKPRTERSLPVHPTQVYSSINGLLLCLVLLAYGPFRRRDGELLALLLTIYPIARFLLEIIRTDEPGMLGTGLSIAQNMSLVLLLFAAGLWYYILRQPRGRLALTCGADPSRSQVGPIVRHT